jgi:hypothetical protein
LQDRPASGTAAQNRDASLVASGDIYFSRHAVGVAHYDEMSARFPQPENFILLARFTEIEQCFVAGEVLSRGSKREFDGFHCVAEFLLYFGFGQIVIESKLPATWLIGRIKSR